MNQKRPVDREEIAGTLIAELLEKWPETAGLFKRHNMACVGCMVAPFYSVEAAISIYGLSRADFLSELIALIEA